MSFNRSGSRYSRKIVPIRLFIAYEGIVDEREYFHALKNTIPQRFEHLIELIPVDKSSTASSPGNVVNDLSQYLATENIRINSDNLGFIVIDKDHWSKGTHQRSLSLVVQECRQKKIDILFSVPSFDLWLLCHYLDINSQSEAFKKDAFKNDKLSRSQTFLKKELSKARNGESYEQLISRTNHAIENANRMNANVANHSIFPSGLFTSVHEIIEILKENNTLF